MKTMPSQRFAYLMGFFAVSSLLIFALYLEFYKGIQPCPLCVVQRLCLVTLGMIFLIGAAFNFKKLGCIMVGLLAFFFSFAGVLLSGRQAWLQHNPSGLSSNCDVSLQYMLQAMPLDEVIKKIFRGGTECSHIDWQFLHLSLAELSLIGFAVFLLFSLWQLCRKK